MILKQSIICLATCLLYSTFGWCGNGSLSVAEFLPEGYVRDGSVSYQLEVQQAIDVAAEQGVVLVFPAMTYAASVEGWELRSGSQLVMTGAEFLLGEDCDRDGAVFRAVDVDGLRLQGGEIVGRNDVWADGVNVRGVYVTGKSRQVRISEMRFRDLSSNGIGIFGDKQNYVRDVWVEDVIVENCCKRYPDYLSDEKPEKGSVREDQGDVAFYYVEDFTVQGCRFERSRSDATHFYRCRRGQLIGNRIYRAKMGGYFLETCESVVGTSNIMLENGSRGTTIERGSVDCVFANNVVESSGREGLWAPNCRGLVVTGNVFKLNGRKPNGPEPRFVWNANITINSANHDPTKTPPQDYLISDNLIYSSASQVAAIRVDAGEGTRDIVIRDNMLLGDNSKVQIEGENVDAVYAD